MTLKTLITSLESAQIHHLLAARNKPEVFSISWSLSWWQPLRYVWPNITAPLAVSGGEQGDLMSAHLLESLELKETQHTGFPACYNSQLDFCTCLFLSGRITNYSQPPGQEEVLEMYKNTIFYHKSLSSAEPFIWFPKIFNCGWNMVHIYTSDILNVTNMTYFHVTHNVQGGF